MADVSVSVGAPSQISVTVAGSSGGSALVTNGSVATVTVTQAGDRGPKGDPGSVNLSDATPSALGTAAAGTSSLASRADHTHPALTTFPYASLSGVPSTFAPATHTHTASQVSDFATQAAQYGPVTSVNGQTGAVTVTTSGTYTLPTATDTVLGGVKVGTGLSITSGVLSATGGGGASLSDATPSALGTASAGTSSTASRSDHTHGLPSLSTLGAAAANHAHPYVTGLNSLTGALTLAAGSNVTLTASGSTITIAATGGSGDDVDGGDYVGVVAPVISISSQPTNQTAASGSATFSVTAGVTQSASLNYQWQRSDDAGATWASIAGATLSTLSLTGLSYASDHGKLFRVVVGATDGAAIVTSSVVTLTVPVSVFTATQTEPAKVRSWFVTLCSGLHGIKGLSSDTSNFRFPTVSVTPPSGTVTYQWEISTDGAQTWNGLAGQQSATLQITFSMLGSWLTHPLIEESGGSLTTQYPSVSRCVRCRMVVDGVVTYSRVMPVLRVPYSTTAGYSLTNQGSCNTFLGIKNPGGGVAAIASSGSSTASVELPWFPQREGGGAFLTGGLLDPFRQSSNSAVVRLVEKSTDGGVTWNALAGSHVVYSYTSNPDNNGYTLNGLTATDAGNLYRWRMGQGGSGSEVLLSDYMRLDYVVIGFTAPTLASQTAAGGQATFTATIPQHSSGVPVTAFWQKSVNGGVSWGSGITGTRQLSGTDTVVSLSLTGLTSADNQSQYRFVVVPVGYTAAALATSNAATLTVT